MKTKVSRNEISICKSHTSLYMKTMDLAGYDVLFYLLFPCTTKPEKISYHLFEYNELRKVIKFHGRSPSSFLMTESDSFVPLKQFSYSNWEYS